MGIREQRPPNADEMIVAQQVLKAIFQCDSRAMDDWRANGKTVLCAHFRGRIFCLGGVGFFAKGAVGICWVRVFQYKAKFFRKGQFLYCVVVDRVDASTGETERLGNFKTVYPDQVVADIDRIVGRIRRQRPKGFEMKG